MQEGICDMFLVNKHDEKKPNKQKLTIIQIIMAIFKV